MKNKLWLPDSLTIVLNFETSTIYVARGKSYLNRFVNFLNLLSNRLRPERIYLRVDRDFWCIVISPYYPIKHKYHKECFEFWDSKLKEMTETLEEFEKKNGVDEEFRTILHFDPVCECEKRGKYPNKRTVKIGRINNVNIYFKVT